MGSICKQHIQLTTVLAAKMPSVTLEHLNCQAIALAKKGNLQKYHNYRTISLITAEDHTEQIESKCGEDHR